MNEYRISLPWPPSNNRYYRHNRGRTHISTEGQAYRDSVARIIKDSMLDIGLATPVKIRIECHMPDRRRRDLDNLQKAAFDALTKAGFWLDDQQWNPLGPAPAMANRVLHLHLPGAGAIGEKHLDGIGNRALVRL